MTELLNNPEQLQALLLALAGVVFAVLTLWALYVKLTPKKGDDARFLKVVRFLKGIVPQKFKAKLEEVEKKVGDPPEEDQK